MYARMYVFKIIYYILYSTLFKIIHHIIYNIYIVDCVDHHVDKNNGWIR